jgi:hypothetical protein
LKKEIGSIQVAKERSFHFPRGHYGQPLFSTPLVRAAFHFIRAEFGLPKNCPKLTNLGQFTLRRVQAPVTCSCYTVGNI